MRNKKMRISAIVAAAAMSVWSLTGCAASGSDASETTLNLLVPSYSDATQKNWETVVSGFEAANPNITVNLEVQSWDNLESVVSTKVQGGQAPDIYNGGPFAGFAADGLLYDVKDVTSPETYSDFQESFLKNEQLDGVTYALPFIASARALFVNNDLLSQAGVSSAPTTWDELLSAATKISGLGNGIAGYGMPLGSEEAQAEAAVWLWGGGGTFGDASKITVDIPANLPGANQIKA
ncbi:MAG: extracellular solute-binding protein, partial [Acinetobacter sp.]